ncbi:unnamed protein product [Echinostoma caproni]|uniref:Ferritin n=1 Tax=Echinostoma caproni TaxID=27848 RepID=A0A183B6F5_9TREM|nr:unnamed protein product [Echinostoma caproni]
MTSNSRSKRTNYSTEVEQEINDLITLHWGASRTYSYLSHLCDRQTELCGFRDYFRLFALRSQRNADRLTRFQVVRGGQVDLGEVKPIIHMSADEPAGMYKFLSHALDTEKRIEQWVRELHDLAETKCDIVTTEFVELHCLSDQTRIIKVLVQHMQLVRSCPSEWLYSQTTMRDIVNQVINSIYRSTVRSIGEDIPLMIELDALHHGGRTRKIN